MLFLRQLLEYETNTYTYILADSVSREAIIIDSVLETVERDAQLIRELGLTLKYILETHIHADHITGASELKSRLGGLIGVGTKNDKVTGNDIFISNGQELVFGSQRLKAIETPGHTAGCMTYLCEDMAFAGDLIFVRGTGRTDLQSGTPASMYESITKRIFTLPKETKIYPGHDYKGYTMTTVGEEMQFNPRIKVGTTFEEFETTMNNLNLPYPKKIDVSLPRNMKCGL